MKKIISMVFLAILAVLCGFMVAEIEQVQAATLEASETIEEASAFSTYTETLEDGTLVTTEEYEDGTIVIT